MAVEFHELGARDDEINYISTGNGFDEIEDEVGDDGTGQTHEGHGESGGRGGDFFLVIAAKEVLKTTVDEHEKKDDSGNTDNDLENVAKQTLETLNGGNIGLGDTATRPGGLGGNRNR